MPAGPPSHPGWDAYVSVRGRTLTAMPQEIFEFWLWQPPLPQPQALPGRSQSPQTSIRHRTWCW